jgi:CheY-like chemotaxis protein
LTAPQDQAKGLPFSVAVDADPGTALVGDPIRFKQVPGNLLSNAIRFTEIGSVKMRVSLVPIEGVAAPYGVTVRVEVKDTGIGIAAQAVATLFQPFTQADAATTRRFGGTGLGLAISSELVELMGGSIGLRSQMNQGSLFWVELPFESSLAAPAGVPEPDSPAPRWTGRQALLVEDHAVNAIVAQAQLEWLGIHVAPAVDGLTALDALGSRRFDVVLVDCQMPYMDGFEAVRRWRVIEQGRGKNGATRAPVIALTANAMDRDRAACIEAGFDDHVGKPYSRETLCRALALWLDSDHAA